MFTAAETIDQQDSLLHTRMTDRVSQPGDLEARLSQNKETAKPVSPKKETAFPVSTNKEIFKAVSFAKYGRMYCFHFPLARNREFGKTT